MKIDGDKYKLIDPFTRIHMRKKNRMDPAIRQKYFSDTFNIKDFVFSLYDNYFPNVTWRYIGEGHFAHRITLQITEFMFQVGLFTFKDVDRILKLILEKSENLLTLEQACIKDGKANRIYDNFMRKLSVLFSDMRYYISMIILHSIVLNNDKSFKESLSFTRSSTGVFKDAGMWNLAYYKNQKLNNIINNVLMKYLLEDSIINQTSFQNGKPESMVFTDEETKTNLNHIFMLISDVDTDVSHVSAQLVTQDLFNYRMGKHQPIFVNGVGFKEQALVISKTVQNFITDVAYGKLGSHDEICESLNFDKGLAHIVKMIEDYFQDSQNPAEYFFKQQALNDQNVVAILMILVKIVLSLRKKDCLKLTLKAITQVCKDNFSTQGQLFMNPQLDIFIDLHEEDELVGTIATTNIFKNDNQILYSNPEIFKEIFELYTDRFEDFKNYFRVEKIYEMNRENEEKIEKRRLEWVFQMDTYNKFFIHLLENAEFGSRNSQNKVVK